MPEFKPRDGTSRPQGTALLGSPRAVTQRPVFLVLVLILFLPRPSAFSHVGRGLRTPPRANARKRPTSTSGPITKTWSGSAATEAELEAGEPQGTEDTEPDLSHFLEAIDFQ